MSTPGQTAHHGAATAASLEIKESDKANYSQVELGGRRDQPKVALVGSKQGLSELVAPLRLVAPTEARVLITGETGTGKNMVATAIHLMHGTRSKHTFRRTNIGALVPELAQSQLFGHVKGAFTGADRSFLGIVREADRGTLFLDQLSDAPSNVQAMLLTLLEVKKVNPVGGYAKDAQPVDVRLLSATIESPEQLLSERKVREDLFYRVMEYHIHLPSLRDRPNEILPLARYFLEGAAELREVGNLSHLEDFSVDAIEELLKHRWPGNVRELEHVIRAAVVASRMDPNAVLLRKEWLRLAKSSQFSVQGYREALDRFNYDWTQRALAKCNGNNGEAARWMGISKDKFRKLRDWHASH